MFRRREPELHVRHLSFKAYAAVGTVQWAARRRATRLSPVFFVLGYLPGTPAAMYLPVPWWVLGGLGLIATVAVAVVSAYAVDNSVDALENGRQARQWALRTAAVPLAGTAYLLGVQQMHARDMDVINWPMFTGYIAGCTAVWLYLFTAGHSGGKRLRDQMARSWFGRVVGTSLEGSKVLGRRLTRGGTEVDVDITATGRRASQLTGADVREEVAARMSLPVERIQIRPNRRDAGKITVQIMNGNPFVAEIPHPRAPGFAGGRRSVTDPIAVGIDPLEMNERKRTITHPLYTADGFQHLVVCAGTGSGKSTFTNSIIEHLTGSHDVDTVLCDPAKGHHGQAWRFAVLRTHLGPESHEAIVCELEQAASLIGSRATARRQRVGRKSATFVPTAEDRALCIVLDEADLVLNGGTSGQRRRAQQAVRTILSKGRSEGVGIIIITQRGTLTFLGTAAGDIKANTYSRVMLGVSQASEQHWMLPNGDDIGLPDMSTYGEGTKGVFLQVIDRQWRAGRAFALYDPELIEAIALERCRPEHEAAMWAYLTECAEAEEVVAFLPGSKLAARILEHGIPEPDEQGVGSGAHLHRTVPTTVPTVPTWGSPGASVGEAVAEAREQTSRAARATAHYARQARERGQVSLEALKIEQSEPASDVPIEFWQILLQLAARHGEAGVARRHLSAALTERLGELAPRPTKVNGLLRACRDKGWVELVERGSASVWHVVKGAPGADRVDDAA